MLTSQTTNALAYFTQTGTSTVRISAGHAVEVLQWLLVTSSTLFTLILVGLTRRQGGSIQAISSTAQKKPIPSIQPGLGPPPGGPFGPPPPGPPGPPPPGPMPALPRL